MGLTGVVDIVTLRRGWHAGALAGFVLSGLAVFIGLGVWRPLAVEAACFSIVTIALFWDWKLALGVAVNVAIVVAVVWAKWPGRHLVGS